MLTAVHLCQHSESFLISVSKKVYGCLCIQLCTAAMTSSLFRNLLPPQNPSLVQTNDNQMELSLDCTVDEAGHPASVSVELPLLKLQCEDECCLGGRKLNSAFFFALSELPASLFHSGELNSTTHWWSFDQWASPGEWYPWNPRTQ
jgi:hypothetical protein